MTDRSLIKTLTLAVFAMALSPALGCTTTSMDTMAESFGTALIVATEATAENWGEDEEVAEETTETETDASETDSCEGTRPRVKSYVRPPAKEGYRWVGPRYLCEDGEWKQRKGHWARERASNRSDRAENQCRRVRDHRGDKVVTRYVCDDDEPRRPMRTCRRVTDHRGGEVESRLVCDSRSASRR